MLTVACCLAGCRLEPSLTKAELAQKYPDKQYVQIDGVSLHYEKEGLGQPVVFLHGFLTYSYLWRTITPGLTYGNAIYTLDLMGFGFSEKPYRVPYSVDTYVAQLGKVLDTLHLDKPILVGHDIGAPIVTLYALRNPGKVRKLVLMDAPLYEAPPRLSVRLLRAPLVGELLTGDWFLTRLLRGGVENQTALTDALLDAYLKPYHDDPGARTALLKCVREFNLQPFLEHEIQPNLANIQLPTLVVWGGNDEYLPVEFGRRLDQDLPHSDIAVILRSGHYVQEDRPEEVRAVLKEFIDQ